MMKMNLNVYKIPFQIDDQPVTHINDIEPLVCESSETIKFLVARPAQEVSICFQGSDGMFHV